MIRIRNLTAGYGGEAVLQNFSLELEPGRIYALIGPSGCGKSTLLKVLCGILPRTSGSIDFAGTSALHSPRIGYVPQNYGLLDWKTVRQNILLPLKIGPAAPAATGCDDPRLGAAPGIIADLGLEEHLGKYPRELSGGQRQRVALARALVSQPELLLMDEPFSALDAFTADASQALFLRLWQKQRLTTLFITHNMLEAASLGTDILLMDPSRRNIAAHLQNPAILSSGSLDVEADKLALAAEIKNRFRKLITGRHTDDAFDPERCSAADPESKAAADSLFSQSPNDASDHETRKASHPGLEEGRKEIEESRNG